MPESPTLQERYEVARDHLKHEDGLINQRVTWFLVFQGLVFTALLAGIALLDPIKRLPPEMCRFVAVVCALLIVLAAVSALVAHALVRAAYWHVDAVHAWWTQQLASTSEAVERGTQDLFPPLRGTGVKPAARASGGLTAAAFLLVLAGAWVVLLMVAGPVLWPHLAP